MDLRVLWFCGSLAWFGLVWSGMVWSGSGGASGSPVPLPLCGCECACASGIMPGQLVDKSRIRGEKADRTQGKLLL
ncbi:hypothetical protein IQ07DRAFT_589515 [Pyrenochaeta sp. DS3sAY3a]|nr:hypothetical protein IQ07DRAFT_589515 [Pyrenochaeta sp. DS3sAY3a]